MDLRQDSHWTEFLHLSGWQVRGKHPFEFYKQILPRIFIRKLQRTDTYTKPSLPTLFTIFEPLTITPKLSRVSPYLPTATIRINKPHYSKNAKRILRKKVLVKRLAPEIFFQNYQKHCAYRTLNHKTFLHLIKAFDSSCYLLGTKHAGLLLLCTDDSSYYYQAWTSPQGRKLGHQYHLVRQALELSRKLKLRYFDFDGIEDPRFPNKSWSGFTQFKKKFGGEIKYFPGAFIKWFG